MIPRTLMMMMMMMTTAAAMMTATMTVTLFRHNIFNSLFRTVISVGENRESDIS